MAVEKRKIVGIDLGTTNSAIAHFDQFGKADILPNSDNERTTPSVVLFEDGEAVVGRIAKNLSVSSPDKVVQFVKRHIGEAKWKRLADDEVGGRSVYVVERSPPEADASAYKTILSFVDKQTCIALRVELYESGRRLRKVFTVNPSYISKHGSVWVPQFSMMQDLRDFTMTQVLVDSSEQDPLSDDLFSVSGLAKPAP